MVSSWIVAGVVIRRTRVLLLVHACHEYAVQRSFARRHFLRRVSLMSLHTRLSFMTAQPDCAGRLVPGFFQHGRYVHRSGHLLGRSVRFQGRSWNLLRSTYTASRFTHLLAHQRTWRYTCLEVRSGSRALASRPIEPGGNCSMNHCRNRFTNRLKPWSVSGDDRAGKSIFTHFPLWLFYLP